MPDLPQEIQVGPVPSAIIAVDLNDDGMLDVVTANRGCSSNGNTVSVLLGRGDLSFAPQQQFGVGFAPSDVTACDLDGDGILDLVTSNDSSWDVSVLYGHGDGIFAPEKHFRVGVWPNALAVADLNGDGRPDIVTANFEGNDVTLLLGAPDGSFVRALDMPVGGGPIDIAVSDIDGDGLPDVLTTNEVTSDVSVLRGRADGSFWPEQYYRLPYQWTPVSFALGDINSDGRTDVVVRRYGGDFGTPPGNAIAILFNQGPAGLSSPMLIPQGYRFGAANAIVLDDFDLNGQPDMLIGDRLLPGKIILNHTQPSLAAQPTSRATCPGGSVLFALTPSQGNSYSFAWQMRLPGASSWATVTDGLTPGVGVVVGQGSPSLQITDSLLDGSGTEFRCIVANSCGSVQTRAVQLRVCLADRDCSGVVDLSDFFSFFGCFGASDPCADVDDSNEVDLGDFFAFLSAFDRSC